MPYFFNSFSICLSHSFQSNSKIDYLSVRREKLCLKFAKKCLKHDKTSDMFPLNSTLDHDIRKKGKFQVQFAHTNRLRDSAIPQLQRALNREATK